MDRVFQRDGWETIIKRDPYTLGVKRREDGKFYGACTVISDGHTVAKIERLIDCLIEHVNRGGCELREGFVPEPVTFPPEWR